MDGEREQKHQFRDGIPVFSIKLHYIIIIYYSRRPPRFLVVTKH